MKKERWVPVFVKEQGDLKCIYRLIPHILAPRKIILFEPSTFRRSRKIGRKQNESITINQLDFKEHFNIYVS